MAISTFHNHTTFCDGNSTMEEMVRAAVAVGCPSIGFSGHVYTWFDESYCMSRQATREYWAEVDRLREAYPQIRILRGIEQDYFSTEPTEGYDFVIGSVHYVEADGAYFGIDDSAEELEDHVMRHFGGDYLALVEQYYHQVEDVVRKTGCTFVGHFDLVMKYNEGNSLFDSGCQRYRRAALAALESLCDQGALFEINTGAMAKGYRSEPYPQAFLVDELKRRGVSVVLSADCHDAAKLLFGLDDSLARGCHIVREL